MVIYMIYDICVAEVHRLNFQNKIKINRPTSITSTIHTWVKYLYNIQFLPNVHALH